MTLSSYRERVLDVPGANNLSEAEANAISMRLMEMMKERDREHQAEHERQLQGRDILGQRRILTPPQELIETMVEEHLKPRGL